MTTLDSLILHEYSGQSGYGSLPYFVGNQYGSGWLRNIARFAFPFLKKAVGTVGTIASKTAEDMLNDENKTIGQTLKKHAVNEAKRILKRSAAATNSTINRRDAPPRKQAKKTLII